MRLRERTKHVMASWHSNTLASPPMTTNTNQLLSAFQHFCAAFLHLLPALGDLLLLLCGQHVEDFRLQLRLCEGELGFCVPDLDAERLQIAAVARHDGVLQSLARRVCALGKRPDAIRVTLVNRLHLVTLCVGQIAHHFAKSHRPAQAPARSSGSAEAAPAAPHVLTLCLR